MKLETALLLNTDASDKLPIVFLYRIWYYNYKPHH